MVKTMTILPAIEFETKENPEHAVIWLHGLGADGNDFAPIVPELRLPHDLGIRFIFPHAPKIPVTVNGGFVMPAWYDIIEMQIDRMVDTDGLLKSSDMITALMEREYERGIDSRSLVLAGFSQGGAVAYQAALSHDRQLGGLLTMSTYFATADLIQYDPANHRIPIEIQHGLYDPVVPEKLGSAARKLLEGQGYQPTYRTYPMEHGVCPEQIGHISRWLQGRLNE
jgi:phospholipase/carboxylesterase